MTLRDPRYDTIKPMMNEGKIKKLIDVFTYIPKTRVAQDMGKKTQRFSELITDEIGAITVTEIQMMSDLFKMDIREVFDLIATQLPKMKTR